MQKRALGKSGLEIAPLVFGGNVFGWTVDEATSFTLLDAFVAAGFNAIDTADVYSTWVPGNKGGESETIIGKWLKRRGGRADIVVLTKVGGEMGAGRKGLAKNYIAQAVEDSLRRLQTDYIDLYQSHYPDPATPIDETLGAYAKLIEQGKVRAIGASNYDAAGLAAALKASGEGGGHGAGRGADGGVGGGADGGAKLPRYGSLQPEYNLYDRAGFEAELESLCVREQVGVIPYFSLASGFLTGKYRSEADFGKSPRGGRMKNYLNDRGRRILTMLDAVAAKQDATPAQIALAWLIARPGISAPIASATTVAQLEDLAKAARITLDAESIGLLDATA